MSTIRFFSGARSPGSGMSKEDIRFFLDSRKKLTAAERWKRLRDRKFVENKKPLHHLRLSAENAAFSSTASPRVLQVAFQEVAD